MSNLALVDKQQAAPETDWAAIEKSTASFQEMGAVLKMEYDAVRQRAARGHWMTHSYPSRKQAGKFETRVLLSQLKQTEPNLFRRLMRARRASERAEQGKAKHHGGEFLRDGRDGEALDGRATLTFQEIELIQGIYLSPKYGRPDAAGVFDHLKTDCIRCHGGEMGTVDNRFAGRYKQWTCGKCGFHVSYWTVYRKLKGIMAGAVTLARGGVNAFVNEFGYYMKRDWSGFRPNEEVFGDNHPCDLFVWDPREPYLRGGAARLFRPQMSAWQDIGTGGVAVRIGERTNADTLALSMRAYILRWGKPEGIVTDNGSDYLSKQFVQFCQDLHIAIRRPEGDECNILPPSGRALPSERGGESHAKSKPIERFFGTFARDFDKQQPGWCGSKPEEKPDNMFLLEKQHDAFLANEPGVNSPFLTIDQYMEKAVNWIEQSFHKVPGRRLDRAPNDVLASYGGEIRRVPERDMDILLMPPVERTIGRRGVVIDHRDYWATGTFDQAQPGMVGLEGRKCQVRFDPGDRREGDIAKVYVFVAHKDLPLSTAIPAGKDLILTAYHAPLLGRGATREDAAEEHRRAKGQRRFYREYLKAAADAATGLSTMDQVLAEKAVREGVPELAAVANGVATITAGGQLRTQIDSPQRTQRAQRQGTQFAKDIARRFLESEEE